MDGNASLQMLGWWVKNKYYRPLIKREDYPCLFHVVRYSIHMNNWPAKEEIEENETRTESYEYVPMALIGGTYNTVYVEHNLQDGPTNERRIVLCIFYSNTGYGLKRTHILDIYRSGYSRVPVHDPCGKRQSLWYVQNSPAAHNNEPLRTQRYQ